jgi:hypothetical protein
LSQFACAHETLLWASKGRGARHTFNYDLINSQDPGSQVSFVWRIAAMPGPWQHGVAGLQLLKYAPTRTVSTAAGRSRGASCGAAAEAYNQAVAVRNWGYTYDHLDSETQSAYTEQEWSSKNYHLADTRAVASTIQSVVMDSSAPETLEDVSVVLTATDGSISVRNIYFVYEGGVCKHRFSAEEYDLLTGAPTGTASAIDSASPGWFPSASPAPPET